MQAVQQNAVLAVSELGIQEVSGRRTDKEISRRSEYFSGQSSQWIHGVSETYLAECWCKHIFLICTPSTILYLSDFNLERAEIQYQWQLAARDEWAQ